MKTELLTCYSIGIMINGKVERIYVAALDIPEAIRLATSTVASDEVYEVVSIIKCHSILV